MSQPHASHILVVDDDTRLRELLKKFLSDQGFYVSTAHHSADAREKMQLFAFDAIVLDLMMPGESGLDLARAIRTASDIPILMLTAMGETEHRIDGLEHGADDYLVKPFDPKELLLRIRAILRRVTDKKQRAQQIRFGECQFDLGSGLLHCQGEMVALTTNEQALLRVLGERPGQPVSRDELLSLSAIGGGERNVDVQITRLRKKIEPQPNRPRYLQTVRGLGYILQVE